MLGLQRPKAGRVGPAAFARTQLVATLQCRQGFLELALLPQRVSEVAPGHGVLAIELDGFVEATNRLIQLVLLTQYSAKVVVSRSVVGIKFEDSAEAGHSPVQVALFVQQGAEVQVVKGMVGVVFDGLAVAGNRLGPLVLLTEHEAEGVKRPPALSLRLDGFAVTGDSLIQLAIGLLDDPEVEAGHGGFWACRQGGPEGAGLFGTIAAGKSKLKVQPEVARMVDQGPAEQS